MGLSDCPVSTAIPVSDLDRAKQFYEGKLGLSGGKEEVDGGVTYTCADGTSIHPYPSPDNAGKSGATVALAKSPTIGGADRVALAADEQRPAFLRRRFPPRHGCRSRHGPVQLCGGRG